MSNLIPMSAATFERSNLLNFSGTPLNNSRTFSFQGEFNEKTTNAHTAAATASSANHAYIEKATVSTSSTATAATSTNTRHVSTHSIAPSGTKTAESYEVIYFLEYLSVCKAFLNNHVVTI